MRIVRWIMVPIALISAVPATADIRIPILRPGPKKAEAPASTSTAPIETQAADPIERCKRFRVKERGKKIVGTVIDKVAGEKAARIGTRLFSPILEAGGILTDAIACKLDPSEQKQAAEATTLALAGEKVGKTVRWASKTRAGVSGSSTVAQALTNAAIQTIKCMLVTDIVIVDGEETLISKRMCRAPGAPRYVLAA